MLMFWCLCYNAIAATAATRACILLLLFWVILVVVQLQLLQLHQPAVQGGAFLGVVLGHGGADAAGFGGAELGPGAGGRLQARP